MSDSLFNFQKQKKYTVIVGFNDMQSKSEEMTREEVLQITTEYFKRIKFPFSVSSDIGGYSGCGNVYCSENNIVFTFVNAEKAAVAKISSAVKMLLNQETVMIYENDVEVAYV